MAFRDWDTLSYGIQRGECILFLGPELSLERPEGDLLEPVAVLRDRLTGSLSGGRARRDSNRLASVSQRFVNREHEVGLEMHLTDWHQTLDCERSTLHEDLAALPFQLIVTSSHDPLMETALRNAGKIPNVERYHYRGSNKDLLVEGSVKKPLLFYLYGHVSEPPSVVLTETQLLDFLAALIAKDPPLPNNLNAQLTNGRFFLFIGFGFRQWYLRILLHVLKVLRDSRTFAFEILDDEEAGSKEDTILFYRENYKMEIHHEDVRRFVRELRRRYVPPASAVDPAERSAPIIGTSSAVGQGVKVFLCHASEDAATAREIHDELKRRGFEPWLDKLSLRGGDDWDQLIESTISEVDYVLVLNSEALTKKTRYRSYVNKEIEEALRAAKLYRREFLIPVKVDDTPLIKDFEKYHGVRLNQANGMRELIRAINRENARV